jgi:hypothetical protein
MAETFKRYDAIPSWEIERSLHSAIIAYVYVGAVKRKGIIAIMKTIEAAK